MARGSPFCTGAYILPAKHNSKVEVHKTDCAHDCKNRIISVSLDTQAKN